MKICSKCKIQKDYIEFSFRKEAVDGYRGSCKICCATVKKNYRLNNIEKYKEMKKQQYISTSEIVKQRTKLFKINNPDKIKIYKKTYNQKNKAGCNIRTSKRRCMLLNAIPDWLTEDHFNSINEFYKKASDLQKQTGIKYHVDHIIPIQGKTVCGLHVPWNLQILEASANISKSNKLEEVNNVG